MWCTWYDSVLEELSEGVSTVLIGWELKKLLQFEVSGFPLFNCLLEEQEKPEKTMSLWFLFDFSIPTPFDSPSKTKYLIVFRVFLLREVFSGLHISRIENLTKSKKIAVSNCKKIFPGVGWKHSTFSFQLVRLLRDSLQVEFHF